MSVINTKINESTCFFLIKYTSQKQTPLGFCWQLDLRVTCTDHHSFLGRDVWMSFKQPFKAQGGTGDEKCVWIGVYSMQVQLLKLYRCCRRWHEHWNGVISAVTHLLILLISASTCTLQTFYRFLLSPPSISNPLDTGVFSCICILLKLRFPVVFYLQTLPLVSSYCFFSLSQAGNSPHLAATKVIWAIFESTGVSIATVFKKKMYPIFSQFVHCFHSQDNTPLSNNS